MCIIPKKPDLSGQKEEAKRQAAAEQDRRQRDKSKRLEARRGGRGGASTQSLVSLNAPASSARSFFSATGSAV